MLFAVEDKARVALFLSAVFSNDVSFRIWVVEWRYLFHGAHVPCQGSVAVSCLQLLKRMMMRVWALGAQDPRTWCLLACKCSCPHNYCWNSAARWIDFEEIAGDRRSNTWKMEMTSHCRIMRMLPKNVSRMKALLLQVRYAGKSNSPVNCFEREIFSGFLIHQYIFVSF